MVSVVVIPIIIVAIAGLAGYLVYRCLILDMSSRRAVTSTLRRYHIDKTPSQIVHEYHMLRGQDLSDGEIRGMEKKYMRQGGPDRFLEMYDELRRDPAQGSGSDDTTCSGPDAVAAGEEDADSDAKNS